MNMTTRTKLMPRPPFDIDEQVRSPIDPGHPAHHHMISVGICGIDHQFGFPTSDSTFTTLDGKVLAFYSNDGDVTDTDGNFIGSFHLNGEYDMRHRGTE